jgi:hypothetical protein
MEAAMPNDDAKVDPDISLTDELDPADFAVIADGLSAYDFSQIGYRDFRRLSVVVVPYGKLQSLAVIVARPTPRAIWRDTTDLRKLSDIHAPSDCDGCAPILSSQNAAASSENMRRLKADPEFRQMVENGRLLTRSYGHYCKRGIPHPGF